MRLIKNVLTVALDFIITGTRLIANMKIYSHFIFLIFIIFFGISLFVFGCRWENKGETLQSNSLSEISRKIEILEEKAITKAYENLPNFVRTFIAKIPKNLECQENSKWMPGIYYLLNSGGESIIFYDSTGDEKYFQYLSDLENELNSLNISSSTLQVFGAFSETTSETQLRNAYSKMKEFGIKRIKLIFEKDDTFVEKNAFDPQQINFVKRTEEGLVMQGMSPSDARIKAIMPLLKSCPTFANTIIKIRGKSYDDLKVKIINEVKNKTELKNCNIRNVIDYCLLTYCSGPTYGIVEIDIDDFEMEAKKAFH